MQGFDVSNFLDALVNPFLLMGALVTAGLTVAGLTGGFIFGLLVAVLRSSSYRALSRFAQVYIWFFRGTPLLIQMVAIYSGLPQVGIKFGVFTSVLVALISNEAAYMAEIIRGGQTDAAKALGLNRWQTLTKIQLPQAVRIILPAVGNSVNGLLKATSIASVISMEELMRRSEMIMQLKFDVLEVFAAAAIDYLVLTTLWDQVQKRLEKRFNRGELAKVAPAVEQAALPR